MTNETKKDKYDRAIEYLTEHPEKIEEAWNAAPVRPDEVVDDVRRVDDERCLFAVTAMGFGCLTQVFCEFHEAPNPELTEAIRADHRIPKCVEYITPEDLPVFAEWQRRIDAMYERGEL
jgi:hypothetical protein